MRVLKIHLRAAVVAAGGDVDRAARMLGLTSGDAARLLANDTSPPQPTQTSGTFTRFDRDRRRDDDEDDGGSSSA